MIPIIQVQPNVTNLIKPVPTIQQRYEQPNNRSTPRPNNLQDHIKIAPPFQNPEKQCNLNRNPQNLLDQSRSLAQALTQANSACEQWRMWGFGKTKTQI